MNIDTGTIMYCIKSETLRVESCFTDSILSNVGWSVCYTFIATGPTAEFVFA
jgi:hypothetical protein